METKIVHIVPSDKGTIHQVMERELPDKDFFWIYLGGDVPFDLEMRKYLSQNKGERISIAEQIQSAAHEFRDEYIKVIGDLMPDTDLQSWWLSDISEKNPFVFNPFLAFCYIRSALFHARYCQNDLLVICQTRGLSDALIKKLTEERVPFRKHDSSISKMRDNILLKLTGLVRLGGFAGNQVIRLIVSRIFSLMKKDKKILLNASDDWICIHSWTDKRSFHDDNSFRDVYFGDLGGTLEKRGYTVFFLVDILPTVSYCKTLINLMKTRKNVLLFEEFVSPLDLISALFFFRQPKITSQTVSIGEIDIAPLIVEAQETCAPGPRSRWSYLCYCVAKKIAYRHPPRRFLLTFENHMWEKMFCSGFREVSKKVRIVGYAHTIVNKMYTNYSVSDREKRSAPLPDTIVVNGIHAAEVLAKSGFDPAIIRIGGSLRYAHLQKHREHVVRPDRGQTILVTTSAEVNEALELIRVVLTAFKTRNDIRVIIKCHPTVPYSRIARSLPDLPDNFGVSEVPLNVLLDTVDLVLYTSSASAVEALALGLPVIHVKSEYRIDMNIFEGYSEILSITGEDLKKIELSTIIGKSNPEIPDGEMRRVGIIHNLFSPVDENSYRIFVSD